MSRRAARDERGSVIVLWTLLLTALLVMVAMAVDLGHLRSVRRTNQTVADLSALAGGEALSSLSGLHPRAACQNAVDYVNRNAPSIPTIDRNVFCDGMPTSAAVPCGSSFTPVVATT